MKILQKGTLTPIGWIRSDSMSTDLEERTGRATITVRPEEPILAIGDWILDDEEPGAGIVWRVCGIELQWETRTWRYTLEHIVGALKDQIIFGELDLSGTAANAAAQILARSGGIWTLGGCEYSVSLPYEFDGETLYDALETISDTLPDCVWEFDLSSIPFKLFFRNKPADKICEMRAGRNLRTLRQSVDRSQMYTRFYPIGKEELRITGEYVSQNEDVYGIITRTETNQSIDNEAMLRAWAEDRLRRHCVPTVTISVTGLELADATGEDLDRIRPGRMCQVPLPETGVIINERVVRVSWRDKKNAPEDITATLANRVTDVATIIRKEVTGSSSTAKKGGRAGSKKAKEDHAWFTDTEDHVSMTAEAIIGRDPSGKVNWSRVSDITVNGRGIFNTVTETHNGLVTAQSRIDQTEKDISLVVEGTGDDKKVRRAAIQAAVTDENGYLSSSIKIAADKITLDGNTTLNNVFSVRGEQIHFLRPAYFVSSGHATAISSAGIITGYVMVNARQLRVADITIDGSAMTISYIDGSQKTFRKATSLRGQWSGGTYTVTAQGDSSLTPNKTQLKQLSQSGSVGKIGKYVGQDIYVYATENGGSNGVSTGFHQEVWIDASDVWQDGYDAGQDSGTSYRMYKAYGTNDAIYYGRIYNSAGVALTSESYYWFGCKTNLGGTSAASILVRY